METPAFELIGLTKTFGAERAVDDLSLAVPKGSFFGMLGPNGAGKTTSLSMAVDLLRPDAGTAKIFGVDVWAEPTSAKALVAVGRDRGDSRARPVDVHVRRSHLSSREARSGWLGRGSRRVGEPRWRPAWAAGLDVRALRSIHTATAAAAIRPAIPA